MAFTRFVLQFPEEDTRIDAVLKDVDRIIHDTTSGLPYTCYLSIDTVFSLVCGRVFGHALKSIKANHTMVFETKEAINFVAKHVYNLTNEVILSSLLIATIEYMIAISKIFGLESLASASIEKLYRIQHEIGISSEHINVFLKTCFDRESSIQLQSDISQLFARKTGSKSSAIIGVKSFLTPSFCKNSDVIANELQFASSSNAAILYFRKLLDIDPLSFADVDTWTVETLDILEN